MFIRLIFYIIKILKKLIYFLGLMRYISILDNFENNINIMCNNIIVNIKTNYPKLFLLYLQYNKDKNELYIFIRKLLIAEQYIWAFICDWKRVLMNFILLIFGLLPFILLYKVFIFIYKKLILYIFLIIDFLFLDIIFKNYNLKIKNLYSNIRWFLFFIFYDFWFKTLINLYLKFRAYYTFNNICERFIMRIINTFNLIIKFFVGITNLIIKFFVNMLKLIDNIIDFVEFIILSIKKHINYLIKCKKYYKKLFFWYLRKLKRFFKRKIKLTFRWLRRAWYIYLIWYLNVIYVYTITIIKYILKTYFFSIFFKKEREKKILRKTKFWIINYKIFIINFDKFILINFELFYNLTLFKIADLLCKYDLLIFDYKYYKSILLDKIYTFYMKFNLYIMFYLIELNIPILYIPWVYDIRFICRLIYNHKYKNKFIIWIMNSRIKNIKFMFTKSVDKNKNRSKYIKRNRHSNMRKYYMNYVYKKYAKDFDTLTIYPEDWNRSYIYKIIKFYVIVIDIIKFIISILIILYILYIIILCIILYKFILQFPI